MVNQIFELLNWPSFAIGIIATGTVIYFLGLRDPFLLGLVSVLGGVVTVLVVDIPRRSRRKRRARTPGA
jgi:hypothetical protein